MATSSKQLNAAQIFHSNNLAKASKISSTQILLNLEKGEFNPQEAWFIEDDDGQEYVVMPQNILKHIISIIRTAHEEKLYLELSRDISQNIPIDFDDVMAVALENIESKRLPDGSLPKINTKSLIKTIKKQYPNLFLTLPERFLSKGMR